MYQNGKEILSFKNKQILKNQKNLVKLNPVVNKRFKM